MGKEIAGVDEWTSVFCSLNQSQSQTQSVSLDESHNTSKHIFWNTSNPESKSTHPVIQSAGAGWEHSLIVDDSGGLWVCGSNTHGQCGFPVTTKNIYTLQKLVSMASHHVISVACGLRHSIALTDTGEVYAWGCNKYGQLAHENQMTDSRCLSPTLLAFSSPSIVAIAAGCNHSVFLGSDNRVWTAGRNRFGQLARNPLLLKVSFFPILVEGLQVEVDPMEEQRIQRNKEQQKKEQDPQVDVEMLQNKGSLVKNEQTRVKSILAGWHTTGILLTTGKLILFGRNDRGQLHHPPSTPIWTPAIASTLPPLSQISAGAEHFLALTTSNSVISWGWNEHGNCAVGHQRDLHHYQAIELPNTAYQPALVSCGYGFSMILCQKLIP